MKIHSLEIKNFRVIRALSLPELPQDGVIVIDGENERGKSTTLQALYDVLFTKHNSKTKEIRQSKPRNRDEGPEVTVHISLGNYEFTLHKRWMSKALCELTVLAPKRQNFLGQEAEQQLEDILSANLDKNLYDVLFLKQDSLDASFKAAGIPSLRAALEDTRGEKASNADDAEIVVKVQSELSRYFTKGGKPSKELKAASEKYEESKALVATIEERYQALEDSVAKVEKYTEQRDRATELETPLEKELADAQEALETARQAEAELELATAAVAQAQEKYTQIKDRQNQLQAQRSAVSTLETELVELEQKIEHTKERVAEQQKLLDEATDADNAAQEAVATARTAKKTAREELHYAECSAEIATLEEALGKIAELEERMTQLQAVRAVADEQISALEEAIQKQAIAQSLRDALATKVTVSAPKKRHICVDGEDRQVAAHPTDILVTQEMAFVVDDVTLVVDPGGDAQEHVAAAEHAVATVRDLLEELECADIDEARTLRDQSKDAQRELDTISRQLEGLLGGVLSVEAKKQQLASLISEREDCAPGNNLSVEDARIQLVEAEEQEEQALIAAAETTATLNGLRNKDTTSALTELNAIFAVKNENLCNEKDRLSALEEATSEEEITRNLTSALAAIDKAELALDEAKATVAESNIDQAQSIFSACEAALKNNQLDLQNAKNELLRLDGEIKSAAGIAEELEHARARCEEAKAQYRAVERKAQAAKLLYETLSTHYEAARRKYAQPFALALTRFAKPVFGADVEFNLDDELAISARTLKDTTIELDELSGGAQEQVALISRFAVASLISDESVPIFVDDALGSTDSERLKLMAALFNEAGKNTQVFVLTCAPERYRYVTDKHEYHLSELAEY